MIYAISRFDDCIHFHIILKGCDFLLTLEPLTTYRVHRIEKLNIIKFIGCGCNEISSVRSFMIDNSTFHGQNDSGTVLDITDSSLTIIVNSSFFPTEMVPAWIILMQISSQTYPFELPGRFLCPIVTSALSAALS